MVGAAARQDRLAAVGLLALLIPWLTYTRAYFWLHPKHLTFDPSAFMYLTGRPDPSCGLTRTFAWMWRGDIAHAVAVYPLGPLAFAASFVLVGYSTGILFTGRALRLNLSAATRRFLAAVTVLAVAFNWAAKLAWLGM